MSVEFHRGLPESLTQGLLVGKLLVGELGVQSYGSYGVLTPSLVGLLVSVVLLMCYTVL